MFACLIMIETVVLHLLIQHWSTVFAWILTASSIYTLFWLLGDYQASRLHPLVLGSEYLYVRTGLRWQVDIPLVQIAGIRKATRLRGKASNYLNAAVYGEPRCVLELREPVVVHGLFGTQRTVTSIGLTVDDESQFQATLREHMVV